MAKKNRDGRPRNHRTHESIVSSEPRCIYCSNTAAEAQITLEHMPPVVMFRDRLRLKGMEYATCKACNNGTAGADAVAAFMARIDQTMSDESWQTAESRKLMSALKQRAPGVLEDIFGEAKTQPVVLRSAGGVLIRQVKVNADGPMLRGYMNVFAAKLAMALFREHVGFSLPMDGRIETIVFFNAGLTQATADAMLEILPIRGALTQGKNNVSGQFAYRYNTDGAEIVAALVGFHSNLHIFAMASCNPIYEGVEHLDVSNKCRPGQLLAMLPKKRALILPGLPGWSGLVKPLR